MNFSETRIKGVYLIKAPLFKDSRGVFSENFHREKYSFLGSESYFVQDNYSTSLKGTLRGLHFQKSPHAQAKLVRALQGEILDVAVDLRPSSPTFGQHVTALLSEDNGAQLFIPRGFAHGFSVLSAHALVYYKCDSYYNVESEAGLRYDDQDLNIDWKLAGSSPVISQKDLSWPFLNDMRLK